MASGVVEVKGIVREPGSRAKIAVKSSDEHVDPVGALVGQRGVRVAVVTSELGGEKIDVVEWSETAGDFVKEALKPAQVLGIELFEEENRAVVQVAEDQQSLAIGRGGQNVRLAARLTGWKIDIRSTGGDQVGSEEAAAEKKAAPAETPETKEETPEEKKADEAEMKGEMEDEMDAAPAEASANDTTPAEDKPAE